MPITPIEKRIEELVRIELDKIQPNDFENETEYLRAIYAVFYAHKKVLSLLKR